MTSTANLSLDNVFERLADMDVAYGRATAAMKDALGDHQAALKSYTIDAALAPHRDGTAAIKFAVDLGDKAVEFLLAWLEGDTSHWPEFKEQLSHSQLESSGEAPVGEDRDTPPADWFAQGLPDPHSGRYDCSRAALIGGELTDDEVANTIYLDPSEKNVTIAKDRIRWLSRQLIAAKAKLQERPVVTAEPISAVPVSTQVEPHDFRQEVVDLLDSPTVQAIANIFAPENLVVSKSFSEQIADVIKNRKAHEMSPERAAEIRNAVADAMRGDEDASNKHREAASLFLFWPSNFIDLAKSPESYPQLVVELAKFIARWEEIGRTNVTGIQEDEAVELLARLFEKRATAHLKMTEAQFEHWWTIDERAASARKQKRALAKALLQEFKVVRK